MEAVVEQQEGARSTITRRVDTFGNYSCRANNSLDTHTASVEFTGHTSLLNIDITWLAEILDRVLKCERARAANDPSVFTITEKAPTRAFS